MPKSFYSKGLVPIFILFNFINIRLLKIHVFGDIN
jgi:hypothetical protein